MNFDSLIRIHEQLKQAFKQRRECNTTFEDMVNEYEGICLEDLINTCGEMLHSFDITEDMFEDALTLMERKNHDYADSERDVLANLRSCEQLGICLMPIGILVRMSDKAARLRNLKTKEAKVKEESITDTKMDIINYSVLLIACKEEESE